MGLENRYSPIILGKRVQKCWEDGKIKIIWKKIDGSEAGGEEPEMVRYCN